jgi:hypothetical protein
VNCILFETDWLASQPVFYNERTGQASHNINDVIDYTNLEFDREGFNNYVDFGYSVLEQTPVKHVKFLRHSSRLLIDESGKLKAEYLADPLDKWFDYKISEDDVIDLVKERVRAWEATVNGEIVIPTSGGYDSRLLNWCIKDKSRIRTFTYGISENQAKSYEVVYAQRLSEVLGTSWEQIPLGDFHKFFADWEKLFGVSTHAHGMYHFEFYQKVLPKLKGNNPLLSGIFGDVWAGSTHVQTLEASHHLNKLGYTHDLTADIGRSLFHSNYESRLAFWEAHHDKLGDERYQVILTIRLKIILISYLLRVPAVVGFNPWSPFLDIDVCMAMLNLPRERRRQRIWQKEFFQKCGLDLESMNLNASNENTLHLQALSRLPVRPLDVTLLSEVVQPDYVEWINRNVQYGWRERTVARFVGIRKIGGALRRLGFSRVTPTTAYNAYCVLLPIENLLRKANRSCKPTGKLMCSFREAERVERMQAL